MSVEVKKPAQPTTGESAGATVKTSRRYTRTGARQRPSGNFELFSWYYFRISGILLLFFALGHLFIMHILNDVNKIDYQFIVDRWANPLWRTYDWILLFLALTHGLNGVRVLIYDYVYSRRWRLFSLGTMYVIGAFFLIIGTQVIVTFQPQIQNVAK